MKLLICGGTGFIGRNLIEHYSKDETYELHATYFTQVPNQTYNVNWHQTDLRNPSTANKITQDMDIIIHAAAVTSGAHDIVDRPHIHITDNIVMNAYLFQKAHENKVKHVIFLSCTIMYPHSIASQSKETDTLSESLMNPYYFGAAQTKLYAEKLCQFYAHIGSTKFTALRHSNIYGPYDKFDRTDSHVCAALISKIMDPHTKRLEIWGNGKEKRDLLYISDLINCIDKVIKNQNNAFECFNCGSENPTSINDLATYIQQVSRQNKKITHNKNKPSINTSIQLNCDKIKLAINWQAEVALEDGLNKTVAWYRQHKQLKKEAKEHDTV